MTTKRIRYLMFGTIAGVWLLITVSCDTRPDGVLSEGEMADVLADLALVESLSDNQLATYGRSDSVAKVYRQSIMAKHGVTEAEFDSTLNWYGHNLEDYAKLYASVDKRIEDREKHYSKATGQKADKPENSLLPLPQMLSVGANDPDRGFSFAIDGKKLKKGDCLSFKMRFNRLNGSATVYLAAEYPGMETFYIRRQVHTSGPVDITLQTDSARVPDRIAGYVHLTDLPSQRVWIDSLTLTATPLLPASYHRIHTATRISPHR